MILVDTSVWIDHLRTGRADLSQHLESASVLIHPFVIGELACGNLKNRTEILNLLAALPQAPLADHTHVLTLIESYQLAGRGLGWVDVHLLASALLCGAKLWTLDKPLGKTAASLQLTPS